MPGPFVVSGLALRGAHKGRVSVVTRVWSHGTHSVRTMSHRRSLLTPVGRASAYVNVSRGE
jgi:hypothetical protein